MLNQIRSPSGIRPRVTLSETRYYSRLMSDDEPGTMRTLTAHRVIMDGLIFEHGGRIANTAGASVLAEFPSVVDAVECAVAVQETSGGERGDRGRQSHLVPHRSSRRQ